MNSSHISLFISGFSLLISVGSLVYGHLTYKVSIKETSPQLKFEGTHISNWNKKQLVLYSFLKNPGNKDIQVTNIGIYWFAGKEHKITQWLRHAFIIKKHDSYKMEIILTEDFEELLKDQLHKIDKAEIILDTIFGDISKTVRPTIEINHTNIK